MVKKIISDHKNSGLALVHRQIKTNEEQNYIGKLK